MNPPSSSSGIKHISIAKLKTIRRRLSSLYGLENADHLLERLYMMIGRYGVGVQENKKAKEIIQRDSQLRTYAHTMLETG